jgi:predicted ATP-binding protein involved in virulence
MAEPTQTVRITSIAVEGLFGLYNHKIILKEERITVIHGPNGVGKTVLLKLTNAFLNGHYHAMLSTPFSTFQVEFSDGSLAKLQQQHLATEQTKHSLEDSSPLTEKNVTIIITLEEADHPHVSRSKTIDSNTLYRIIKRNPYLTPTPTKGLWIDRRTDEILSEENILARVNELSKDIPINISIPEPDGLLELRQNTHTHFIETQRLIRLNSQTSNHRYQPSSPRNTVEEYAKDLQQKLETTLADYAKASQRLDQTFPRRLLEKATQPISPSELNTSRTINTLKSDLQQIETEREQLKKIGVLDREETGQTTLQSTDLDSLGGYQLSVMVVYAQDSKQKLEVLKPLSEKVEILLDILNRKFTNKTVKISREDGLVIEGANNKIIPLSALSSGEQHELVLLYDLLFKVKPNTLVMIDEPELSLHISWQKDFMDDLLKIIHVSQFDVLLATHSPYIVENHSELMVSLSSDITQP